MLMYAGRAVGFSKVIGYGTTFDSKEKWGFLHCYNQLCDQTNHKPTSNEYLDQTGKNMKLTTMVSYFCLHTTICLIHSGIRQGGGGDFTYTLYYLNFFILLINYTAILRMSKLLKVCVNHCAY